MTVADLVTALVVLTLLLGALLPAVRRLAQAASDRKTCSDNLRQIGQAMLLYASENKGSYPRVLFEPGGGSPVPTAYTNPNAPDPFKPGGPAANDVTAALFLLLRTEDLTSNFFVCPSAPAGEPWDFGAKPPNQLSNFPGRQFLSYSYANPYPSRAAIDAGLKFTSTLGPEYALAGDMNSGVQPLAGIRTTSPRPHQEEVNSRNHGGQGQNVLYADGHVEWADTVFCGMTRPLPGGGAERDNIYTANMRVNSPSSINAAPQDPQDSVLLPRAIDGPIPAASSVRRRAAPPPPPQRQPQPAVRAAPQVVRRTPGGAPSGVDVHVHDVS